MDTDSSNDRLDSWKEIAVYLKRDKRTIQRWEAHEGLPIHRKLHDRLASIYAYKSELDMWWRGSHSRPATAVESSLPRRPLLAVLPLRNLSGNSDEEYFSDGLTEELISQLSRIHPAQLGVIARGSTVKYKGAQTDLNRIARELGASYILDGSVRRSNNRVRIAIQLIEVSDSGHLWADSYDRDLSDILQLQDEVAGAVTTQIAGQLVTHNQNGLQHGRRVAPKAYEAYLRGRVFWGQRNPLALGRAVTFFQESISIDSSYAPAYAGLADSYSALASMALGAFSPSEVMPKAKTAAVRAVELDSGLAEANASLALVELFYEWNWERAASLFERALKLNAGSGAGRQWYAEYLGSSGRISEAIRELHTAQEVDPLSLTIPGALATMYYFDRNYDEAIALSRRTLEGEPDFVLATLNLGRAYEQKKMYRQAIAHLSVVRERHPDSTAVLMELGRLFAASGKGHEARQLIGSLKRLARKRYVPAFHFAAIHAALGDHDHAFTWLQRAREERCDYLVYLDREPAADKIRRDPRYAAIVPHAPDHGGTGVAGR